MFCGHEDKGSAVLNGLGYISEDSDGVLDELTSEGTISCVDEVIEVSEVSKISDENTVDNTVSDFRVTLTEKEKVVCLREIIKKLKKILYVYDKSLEPNSSYDYKIYSGGVMLYVSSSNMLFDGELVNIVINLNAILTNDFSKSQLKRVVFECVNYAQYLLSGLSGQVSGQVNNSNNSNSSNHYNKE